MQCITDIYCADTLEESKDPNQVEIDYEDISDSYDDSTEHKTIVNNYLKKK